MPRKAAFLPKVKPIDQVRRTLSMGLAPERKFGGCLMSFGSPDPLADPAERALARVSRSCAELVFDPEEAVVFCDAVRTRGGAGLDLTGVGGNRDIRDGRILRFAGAVRGYRGKPRPLRHLDGFQRFGERADLVDLDENGIRVSLLDAAGKARLAAINEELSSLGTAFYVDAAVVAAAITWFGGKYMRMKTLPSHHKD